MNQKENYLYFALTGTAGDAANDASCFPVSDLLGTQVASATTTKVFHTDSTNLTGLNGAGGKSFVSGADISKFDKERSSKDAVLSYNKRTQKVYENLETFPKPTIAMINGCCIGGGLNVAVCCDIRICSKKSKFAMPAAKLSLGYPFSSIKRLFDVIKKGR